MYPEQIFGNSNLRRFNITSFAIFSLFSVAFLFILGGNVAAQARRSATVDVGRQTSFGMRREVNGSSVRVAARNPDVARGWWDGNQNRLRIEGLRPGQTLISFSGTYREITVGNVLRERGVPFRDVITVTVLPRFVPIDSKTIPIQVTGNRYRDYSIHVLMGPEFRNKNEEGILWRNLQFFDGNNAVADGKFDNFRLKLRINGIQDGTTQLTLIGEVLNDGVWQPVKRVLRVTVRHGG